MSFEVLILRRAQRELAELPDEIYQRARTAIFRLGEQPRPAGSRKLTGREGWRIRVGNYRVIYEIDDVRLTVIILHIGHRRDVYR